MDLLLGIVVGLCGAILWGRATSPRTSPFAVLSLVTLLALGVVWTASEPERAGWAGILASLVMVLGTPFIAAIHLGEDPAFAGLSYPERLRAWISPRLRRALREAWDGEENRPVKVIGADHPNRPA